MDTGSVESHWARTSGTFSNSQKYMDILSSSLPAPNERTGLLLCLRRATVRSSSAESKEDATT